MTAANVVNPDLASPDAVAAVLPCVAAEETVIMDLTGVTADRQGCTQPATWRIRWRCTSGDSHGEVCDPHLLRISQDGGTCDKGHPFVLVSATPLGVR